MPGGEPRRSVGSGAVQHTKRGFHQIDLVLIQLAAFSAAYAATKIYQRVGLFQHFFDGAKLLG